MFFKRKKLTEKEFTAKFAKELTVAIKGIEIIAIENLEIKSKLGDSDEHRDFLDNCYQEYLREPKNIKPIFQKYINGCKAGYAPKEAVNLNIILPIIKDQKFVNGLKALNIDFEKTHVFEKYNSELYIFYAEDKELSTNYITQEDFQQLAISLDDLREKAIENFSSQVVMKKYGGDGYFMITAGGNYEASLLLLNIWEKENFEVNGDIVIAIPARDMLLVTGSKDSKNLHKLYDVVQETLSTGNHLVSDKLFELIGDKFELFKI